MFHIFSWSFFFFTISVFIIPRVRSIKGVYSFCLFCNYVCLSVYEVYRGYIVFAFSVIMFVCLFVCKLFFPSKISQQLLGLGF